MNGPVGFPFVVMAIAFLLQVIAAYAGDTLRRRTQRPKEDTNKDYAKILPAAFTLLALIVGFAFSMAVARYDQRKNYEEEEANAIGTEYARADILPSTQAAHIRSLLTKYTSLRIEFYKLRDLSQLDQNVGSTSDLQAALWASVVGPATVQPTPPTALVISGMNDVLNTQGYTLESAEFSVTFWRLVTCAHSRRATVR